MIYSYRAKDVYLISFNSNELTTIEYNNIIFFPVPGRGGYLLNEYKLDFPNTHTWISGAIDNYLYIESTDINTNQDKILKVLKNFYKKKQFVKIMKKNKFLSTNDVINTNFCKISVLLELWSFITFVKVYKSLLHNSGRLYKVDKSL